MVIGSSIFYGGVTMSKYELIIYWSELDHKFIVEVPELPGCVADGETKELALHNVEVVISEWIETAKEIGREVPQPKGHLVYA
jgi:predicted RNase H-like HicB family nuclease